MTISVKHFSSQNSILRGLSVVISTAVLLNACGGSVGSSTPTTNNSSPSFPIASNPRAASSPLPTPIVEGPIAADAGLKGRPHGISLAHIAPIEPYDYIEEEFFFSGIAQERDEDGALTGGPEAPFTSRILVKRPKNIKDFNGTVILEWYNNTGQSDSDVLWNAAYDMLMREGFIHVGVSAQQAGTSGNGPIALKNWDPVRYADLNHPGDAYSWDIYAQAGRALFSPETSATILDNLTAKRMIAGGESQSSFRLVAYSDVIQREHLMFDGFFLHTGPVAGKGVDDVGVPVMHFITETEVDGILALETGGAIVDYASPITTTALPPSPPPYGPDRGLIRVWEVAGASHFDKQLWGYGTALAAREASAPADVAVYAEQPVFCGLPINELGQGRATAAAIHHLNIWVTTGVAPKSRPRLLLDDNFRIVRDAAGLPQGGIQLPPVAAPIGINRGDECVFWGSFQEFLPTEILARYPTHQSYVDAVKAAALENVKDGNLLAEEALLYIEEAQVRNTYWPNE
tara:strand:- start:73092 stop:74639 length:1548 start_codon:yes stop_codon:yes gene_type:complete